MNWLQEYAGFMTAMAIVSVVIIAASIILTPIWLERLPEDYFLRVLNPDNADTRDTHSFVIRLTRTITGSILLIAGVAMLVLPGQGIVTIIAGLLLIDFPGRHRVLRLILNLHAVTGLIQWIRRTRGNPEFRFPEE